MQNTCATVLSVFLVATVAVTGQSNDARRRTSTPIVVTASAVPLNANDRSQTSVGPFTYAGGLVLTSSQTDRLHGLSDVAITGSDRVSAVSDEGELVTARLLFDGAGSLSGVTDARIMALVDEKGLPLTNKEDADAEGLAVMANGDRLVSFERHHRILLYPANGGLPRPVPKPEIEFLVPNAGMEALAPDPDTASDAYVVGAEATGQTWTCRISTRCVSGPTVIGPAGTSLVAMRKLPAGRTAYLYRGFDGHAHIVLRVMRGNTIDAELDLAEPLTVDNIEGVAAVMRPGGVVRFYLMSDDNGSKDQRTLLLAFDWRAPRN